MCPFFACEAKKIRKMYASIGIDEFPLVDVRAVQVFGQVKLWVVYCAPSTFAAILGETSVGTLTRRVSGYFETDGRRHSCEA